MAKVLAGITTSVDGYITGPDDGPGKGLGEGGERLHYWVFGGPWTYDSESKGEPTGEDAAWLEETISSVGAVVGGRSTYEAARHWGDENPWGLPFFIVTHRPEEEPEGGVTASGRIARPLRAEQVQHERDRHLGSERRLGARARAQQSEPVRFRYSRELAGRRKPGPQARVHAVEREREGCVGEQRLQLADGLLRRSGNRLRRDGGEIRVHFVRAVVFQRDRDRRDGEAG